MGDNAKGDMSKVVARITETPTDLKSNAVRDLSAALTTLLADTFALYLKTKNFHWHISGPHFRDYHLLLDEQSDQIFAMTDPLAERVRKIGGTTIRSIGHIARLKRVEDNDADFVDAPDMLAELREDNKDLVARMREVHDLCDESRDVATASLIEVWIDEAFTRRPGRATSADGHRPRNAASTQSGTQLAVPG
jgi:starvation-inducible DNA-binding protein